MVLARVAVEARGCVVETVAIAAHFFVFVDFRMTFVEFYCDPRKAVDDGFAVSDTSRHTHVGLK